MDDIWRALDGATGDTTLRWVLGLGYNKGAPDEVLIGLFDVRRRNLFQLQFLYSKDVPSGVLDAASANSTTIPTHAPAGRVAQAARPAQRRAGAAPAARRRGPARGRRGPRRALVPERVLRRRDARGTAQRLELVGRQLLVPGTAPSHPNFPKDGLLRLADKPNPRISPAPLVRLLLDERTARSAAQNPGIPASVMHHMIEVAKRALAAPGK